MSAFDLLTLFALLVFGHALGDYPLQGDFLAKAKNRFAPLPGIPWFQAMAAHCTIHGGIVGVVTGSLWLGLAEALAHAMIDDLKCRGKITFNQDQSVHLGCKLIWVGAVAVSTV